MAFLPLLEVSSDLNCYPKAVSSHLEQEATSQDGPLLGTVAKTGKIAAIAKVRELFDLKLATSSVILVCRDATWT